MQNTSVQFGRLTICGLDSGLDGRENKPDLDSIAAFDAAPGYRILLCHHPEYYFSYIRQTSIDLVICGHAHGGHWRPFGKAIYSPEQGVFPKYTSGVSDGRCVISRGLGDHTLIPRINNPHELVIVDLKPKE